MAVRPSDIPLRRNDESQHCDPAFGRLLAQRSLIASRVHFGSFLYFELQAELVTKLTPDRQI
jgi:hypothetical protein